MGVGLTQSPPRVIRGGTYWPTSPRSGSTGNLIFRMSNLIKRGGGPTAYWESAAGPQDLSETIATANLTGTLAINSTTTVTGTGTSFLTELHPGQFVLVVNAGTNASYLLGVDRIVSDTSFICHRAPGVTLSGLTGARLPVIFAVDTQRGTAIHGNVAKLDRGTLFSVGDGTFRLNGSTLGGSSLTLSPSPKISLYNPSTGNYTNYALGMPTPSAPTLTAVAGGVKGMQTASYSLVITSERTATLGFNNPSPRADVTITAGQRIQITFAAMDSASGQDAWGVWATRYVDSIGSGKDYLNGPWFRVGQYTTADVSAAGGNVNVEWLDAEIEANGLITFNNDAPPKAEFVATLNGIPVWISCQGQTGNNPGPFIFPAKPGNVEAAPTELAYPTSPPETIIGVVSALGRLYLLTTNHLQIAQGTPSDALPIIIRPFWKAGFKNPYQVTFVDGTLYGETTAGPARSVADGDSQDASQDWAAPLQEFWQDWVVGHVLVEHDPSNDAVIYFHSAHSLNASGYWTTRWWAYGLTQGEWISDGLLTSTTQDMIVSGVARVGNNLEILMGGRKSDNTVEMRTFRFEGGSGSAVPYYMAPTFTDDGEELRPKRVGPVSVRGKLTSASIKVYASGADETVDVSALEAGTGSKASITLTDSADVTLYRRQKCAVKEALEHTVRIEGTYSGSGARDRIDEIVVESEAYGARR